MEPIKPEDVNGYIIKKTQEGKWHLIVVNKMNVGIMIAMHLETMDKALEAIKAHSKTEDL